MGAGSILWATVVTLGSLTEDTSTRASSGVSGSLVLDKVDGRKLGSIFAMDSESGPEYTADRQRAKQDSQTVGVHGQAVEGSTQAFSAL